MSTFNLDKKTFVNFVSNSTVTDKIFTSTENSQGVLITLGKESFEVKEFGNIKTQKVVKTRRFILNGETDFRVNGKTISGTQTWVPKDDILCEAFVSKKDTTIVIDMATNGYIFINDTLINFSGIKLNPYVDIKTKEGITYFKSKTVSRVFYHGHEIKLKVDGEKHIFPKDLPIDEFIYFENKDGSYNNLVPLNFSINTVIVPIGENFYDYTKNYRCFPTTSTYSEEFGEDDAIKMFVTRFTGETVEIRISLCSVPVRNYSVAYLEVFGIHEKISDAVIYDDDITGEEFFRTIVSDPVTIVKIPMKDGTTAKSTIIRYIIPYTQVNQITRYEPFKDKEITTDDYYILNGKFFQEDKSGSTVISLTEKEGTLETYCKSTRTWTIHDLRQESYFNDHLSINVYSDKGTSFDLRTIGYYDEKDSFSFYVNGNSQKNPRFLLTFPTEIKDNFIQTIKLSLMRFDKVDFNINVSFYLARTANVNFIVTGDENFASGSLMRTSMRGSMRKTVGFTDFSPYVDYGQFQIRDGETLYAHQNAVTTESKSFKTFPFVKYTNETTANVEFSDKTAKLHSMAVNEDTRIDLLINSDYVRLNECASVEFKNSALLIPEKTSFCFFKATDGIYMIKSADLRSLTMTNMSSFNNRRKSLAQEPEEEGLIKSLIGFVSNKFASGKDLKTPKNTEESDPKKDLKTPKNTEETEPEVIVGATNRGLPVVPVVETPTIPVVETPTVPVVETTDVEVPTAIVPEIENSKVANIPNSKPADIPVRNISGKPVTLVRPAKPELKTTPQAAQQKPVIVQNNPGVVVGDNFLSKQEPSNAKKHRDISIPEISTGTSVNLSNNYSAETSEGRTVELHPNLFVANSTSGFVIPEHVHVEVPAPPEIIYKKPMKKHFTPFE